MGPSIDINEILSIIKNRKNMKETNDQPNDSPLESATHLTIWTIASETSECYGHGSYGTEHRITREGAYGSGEFPPCFESKEYAQNYLENLKYKNGKVVVPLRLFSQNNG